MRRMREEMKFKYITQPIQQTYFTVVCYSEKQAARQKIIDAQVEQLRKLKNREDEILNKQIKEAEIKAEEVERIKREKREELKVKQQFEYTWYLFEFD